MIDGVFLTHTAPKNTHLKGWDIWETLVNAKTLKRVTDKYTADFRGLDLCLKDRINKDGYRFEVKGSLHKYYNAGLHNADQFTFKNVVQTIDGLTNIVGIEANQLELHGLEIGVNIPLPFAPSVLLKNLVSYGNKCFDQIDKRSVKNGLQCVLSQYAVKIYDKGKQSKTDGNILRVEVSINKMAILEKYGLQTLADLQNAKKVYPLVSVLTDMVKRIIWTDTATDLNQMTSREQKQWLFYSNPRSWENMDKFKRLYHSRKWQNLLSKYGKIHGLENMIKDTWNTLFEAGILLPFYRLGKENEAQKITTFLPLEYRVKKYEKNTPKKEDNNINNKNYIYGAKNAQTDGKASRRLCVSCGKDISCQRPQSRFCSATYAGSAKAKQCRNKDSNKRKTNKAKILKAMTNQNFISITYKAKDGATYTDTLHPTELHLTRHWLDRVQSITILPTARTEPPQKLDGDKAKGYLKSLINNQ